MKSLLGTLNGLPPVDETTNDLQPHCRGDRRPSPPTPIRPPLPNQNGRRPDAIPADGGNGHCLVGPPAAGRVAGRGGEGGTGRSNGSHGRVARRGSLDSRGERPGTG
uniref:Uncharacterized protein n=1 Tax=Amphimedon queenslandica TaxID=400682 RepID=A0A1X7U6K3_AMPQE